MAPQDENPADTAVHRRGSVHNLGEPVARGFLQVARLPGGSIPAAQSGRVELAEWLVHPSNPLTARVMVNRVWHWLFGVGLVRTPDNFGTTGEAPSHPELLDYLADQLIRHDWSLKWLIREIMSSRTYQLSSRRPPKALVSDPENRLLSGMNRRRLDAECLRDTMLLLAGRLRLDMGGPTIAEAASADYGYRYDEPRRTVYVPALRNALLEVVELFDGPDPSVVTGGRNRSTVAPQALYLLNHPFVGTSARQAAQHWLARSSLGPDELLDFVYRLALGRAPTAEEQRVSRIHLTTGDTVGDVEAWTQLWHALFASLDFRYVE
jgi:hypothetical protein